MQDRNCHIVIDGPKGDCLWAGYVDEGTARRLLAVARSGLGGGGVPGTPPATQEPSGPHEGYVPVGPDGTRFWAGFFTTEEAPSEGCDGDHLRLVYTRRIDDPAPPGATQEEPPKCAGAGCTLRILEPHIFGGRGQMIHGPDCPLASNPPEAPHE